MPKLLKRNKAPETTAEAPADATAPAEPEAPPAEAAAAPEPAPEPAPETWAPGNGGAGATGGNGGSRKPGGLITRMYGEPGEMSREERDRQAAMEFEQAVAPVMDLLVSSVPEASSPEEAARTWESRVGELRPDPGAGAYIPGDAFDREARVYYRLLRRDYEKNPRPSLARKRGVTHHLHSQYNRFPGTKGW